MLDVSERAARPQLSDLVEALLKRDFVAIEALLAPDVQFRALIPPGFREGSTAAEAASTFRRWFGDCDVIEALDVRYDRVVDRDAAHYRVKVRENGEWYVCSQHIYANTGERGIERIDVLCSGFRPIND